VRDRAAPFATGRGCRRVKRKLLLLALLCSGRATAAPPNLLPIPASVTVQPGSFSFAHARIAASEAGERAAGERLRSLLARSGGPKLQLARGGQIRLLRDASIAGAEAYRIRVSSSGA
jgi:hexosaminidase